MKHRTTMRRFDILYNVFNNKITQFKKSFDLRTASAVAIYRNRSSMTELNRASFRSCIDHIRSTGQVDRWVTGGMETRDRIQNSGAADDDVDVGNAVTYKTEVILPTKLWTTKRCRRPAFCDGWSHLNFKTGLKAQHNVKSWLVLSSPSSYMLLAQSSKAWRSKVL